MEFKKEDDTGMDNEVAKQEPFFCNETISDINKNASRDDLVKAQHYDLVRKLANGCNIKEACRRTGIKWATLHDELKFWEFAGLVKLKETTSNGWTEKIIECLPLEDKK